MSSRAVILLAVVGSALGARQGVMAPKGHRFKSSSSNPIGISHDSCSALQNCETCTGISFCMWHQGSGFCKDESHVQGKDVYEFMQGSCNKRAGDWLELGGGVELAEHRQNGATTNAEAAAIVAASNHGGDDTYQYHPLMMQPPAIASQDEDHIFQGPFPRPDYGMGELGYKLQGIDMSAKQGHMDESSVPRHRCPGNPLGGCLEKPVIVPQGGVHFDALESRGEFNGHPVADAFRRPHVDVHGHPDDFKQVKHAAAAPEHSMASLDGFTKPKWSDQYDNKDDI